MEQQPVLEVGREVARSGKYPEYELSAYSVHEYFILEDKGKKKAMGNLCLHVCGAGGQFLIGYC